MSARDDLQGLEKVYSKAAKAELERDYDRAFQLYLKAADGFLHLDRTTSDTSIRATCKSEAGKSLERAERIKAIRRDLTPVLANPLSSHEQQLVLQKSSTINGVVYPPWSSSGKPNSSCIMTQPALSPEQISKAAVWRRFPDERLMDADGALSPEDVIQHVVSDCSFCASVAVCVDHHRKFGSRLARSIIYPQNPRGIPLAASDGRHYVRLLFNGAFRRIDIDDQLPTYPDGSLMCMSTGSRSALWPSLLEKAYMKLMGGYDFAGSISSADLHTLIGWIPEYVDIANAGFEPDRTWRRIVSGFSDGLCVLTLGTSEQPSMKHVADVTLIPAHCYAVTDIRDDAEMQSMTVADTWTGALSESQHSSEGELSVEKLSLSERSRSCAIPWDIIRSTFQGIYLNWDPAMFPHTVDFHGTWKRESADTSYPVNFRIQLRVEHDASPGQRSVWLLLTRHVVDKTRQNEFINLSVQSEDDVDMSTSLAKGEYTSATHVLVKTEYDPRDPTLSLVVSYDGEYDDVGFTISAYSCRPLSWAEGPAKLLFHEVFAGAFTSKSAGGHSALPTFMLNPQYHLRIYSDLSKSATGRSAKAVTNVILKSDRHMPLNASIVWSQGQRVTEIVTSNIAASSGPYKYGYTTVSRELQPGDYTLVVSAYEPRHTGSFTLEVDSSLRFDLTPIPQEGAGMFSKPMHDAWAGESAAGGPSFKRYTSNPAYKLVIPRTCSVLMRLQATPTGLLPSINVTLFNSSANSALGSHIATSGPYSDAICGVATPQTTLQAGTYIIIPSTYNPGIESKFRLLVYTSTSGVSVTRTTLRTHTHATA